MNWEASAGSRRGLRRRQTKALQQAGIEQRQIVAAQFRCGRLGCAQLLVGVERFHWFLTSSTSMCSVMPKSITSIFRPRVQVIGQSAPIGGGAAMAACGLLSAWLVSRIGWQTACAFTLLIRTLVSQTVWPASRHRPLRRIEACQSPDWPIIRWQQCFCKA